MEVGKGSVGTGLNHTAARSSLFGRSLVLFLQREKVGGWVGVGWGGEEVGWGWVVVNG